MNFLAFCQLFGVMSRSRLQDRLKLLYILHVKKLTNPVVAPDQVTKEDKMKEPENEGKTTNLKFLPFNIKSLLFNSTSLVPRPRGRREKWPGIHCLRMRERFRKSFAN